MGRKITNRDVCEVSGYNKDELRGVCDTFGIHRDQQVAPRVAREYSRQQLLLITVIRHLETVYGMRRNAIESVFLPLTVALSRPRKVNRKARLLVRLFPPSVSYVDSVTESTDGILVGLQPVFDRVDAHFAPYSEVRPTQTDLALNPSLVRSRGKSSGAER